MIKTWKLFKESKQTEEQALKVLGYSDKADNKGGVDDVGQLLQDFKDIDNTQNKILLPSIAYFYSKGVELESLNQIFSQIPELLNRKLITIQLTKKGVRMKDSVYDDWIKFSEKIDSVKGALEYKKSEKKKKGKHKTFDSNTEEPIWTGNGIKIYSGSDVGKCITLGKGYSFCISQPANTMYQSYRDTKTSTFYFIYDDNQSDNPLKIVVFDNTNNGIELTDARNDTGTIHKYGTDVNGYVEYLKSKGVPVKKLLVNRPKSKEEKKEDELVGHNLNDEKFKKLTPEYKSKYVGRGRKLSDVQFDELWDNKMWDILNQYVNIGHKLNDYQFSKIETKSNLLKSYIRNVHNKMESMNSYPPTESEIKYFHEFGFMKHDTEYPNGKTGDYYLTLINPTVEKIKKYDIITLKKAIETGIRSLVNFLFVNNIIKPSEIKLSEVRLAISKGYNEIAKTILKNNKDDNPFELHKIFIEAVRKNMVDIVEILLYKGIDASYDNNNAIKTASLNGSTEVLKILLQDERVDPSDNYNKAIRNAIGEGHTDVVRLLLQDSRVDPSDNGNDAIRASIFNGHVDVVRILLQDKRVDPSVDNNHNVMMASYEGLADVVELLLQDERVDPSVDNNKAIRVASGNGRADVVELLLQDKRVDPSDNDNEAIRNASSEGHIDVVKLLLQDYRVDPSVDNNKAIRKASENGHVDVVELLLQDERVDPSVDNNKAIILASENGRADVVELLLQDERVDPSAKDNEAIVMASYEGHTEIVRMLFQDSRVDPSDNDNLAIREASGEGHTDVVELLLQDKRVDPSARNNYAIRIASKNGHTEIVKLLLQDDRVDPRDEDNKAIILASYGGHVDVVEVLLKDKRVDPSVRNNWAIKWASRYGHIDVVKLLLQDKRVDPSDEDNEAITWASEEGHVDVVKLLLQDKRVDPSANDNEAIRLASREGHTEIVRMLLADERLKGYENILKGKSKELSESFHRLKRWVDFK
jgi:ankyrin repeat protein